MKSHLHDELQWKIIQDVIIKWEHEAVAKAARAPKDTWLFGDQGTPEGTPELKNNIILIKLFDNELWDLKNWKIILLIIALLKPLDYHSVRKMKFANDIWAYLIKWYK